MSTEPEPVEGEDVQHPEATGLCARPWCHDAALPGEDFCADCFRDVGPLLEEFDA